MRSAAWDEIGFSGLEITRKKDNNMLLSHAGHAISKQIISNR